MQRAGGGAATAHGGAKANAGVGSADVKDLEFQMPVHYPRYNKLEYENMPEWQLDRLLGQYGLPVTGNLEQKRQFAIGAFLWPQNAHAA